MRVNRERKFAYIHIPKTGGVSIVKNILTPLGFERIGRRHDAYDASQVEDDYFVFAFVRNPYSRAVSLYRHRYVLSERFRLKNPDVRTFLNFLHDDYRKHDKLFTQFEFLHPRVELFRFEDFNKEIERLCERLKIKKPVMKKTEYFNYYGDYNWEDWLENKDILTINELFRDDFTLGYEIWTP